MASEWGLSAMKVKENIKKLTTTQSNLAKAIGELPQRITQLIGEGVVIRDENDKSGGVMLFDSIKNYYSSKATRESGIDYWEEKAKHEEVKRKISDLKLQKLDGSVYDAKTVELAMIEQNVTLRTKLLGLPAKLAGQMEGKSKGEMYEMMTKEIEEALMELSKYNPKLFVEKVEDNGGDDDE